MAKFQVDVSWTMTGTVTIEAESEEAAEENAYLYDLDEFEGVDILSDSFQVDGVLEKEKEEKSD